jgi:hypothetical protein
MTPPDILSEAEEGLADLVLGVAADRLIPGGGRCFDVHALHEGELVGLRVELSPGWRRGTIAGSIPSFSGTVTYRSLGDLSDRFVSLLDRLYGVGLDPERMKEAVSFTALTLGDDPAAIDSAVVNMKLFFEGVEAGCYAELYTNLDLPRGVVQICEKDEGYRRPIIQALAGAIT